MNPLHELPEQDTPLTFEELRVKKDAIERAVHNFQLLEWQLNQYFQSYINYKIGAIDRRGYKHQRLELNQGWKNRIGIALFYSWFKESGTAQQQVLALRTLGILRDDYTGFDQLTPEQAGLCTSKLFKIADRIEKNESFSPTLEPELSQAWDDQSDMIKMDALFRKVVNESFVFYYDTLKLVKAVAVGEIEAPDDLSERVKLTEWLELELEEWHSLYAEQVFVAPKGLRQYFLLKKVRQDLARHTVDYKAAIAEMNKF